MSLSSSEVSLLSTYCVPQFLLDSNDSEMSYLNVIPHLWNLWMELSPDLLSTPWVYSPKQDTNTSGNPALSWSGKWFWKTILMLLYYDNYIYHSVYTSFFFFLPISEDLPGSFNVLVFLFLPCQLEANTKNSCSFSVPSDLTSLWFCFLLHTHRQPITAEQRKAHLEGQMGTLDSWHPCFPPLTDQVFLLDPLLFAPLVLQSFFSSNQLHLHPQQDKP